jgi:hypothetical protein|tara:strand:- start:445 stop:1209 length:765 start_codon:yes stop_codon:yes gene_type:complete
MLINKFTKATAVGLVTLLSVSVANAGSLGFKEKGLNGSSAYIGVAHLNSDLADISFMEERSGAFGNVGRGMTSEGRNGKTISFDDPDGLIGTIGHDYGYVRLETELGYRETDVSGMTGVNNAAYTGVSGSVDMGTAMVNLAIEYSIDPGEISGGKSSGVSVTPYITAGAGGLGAHGNLNFLRIANATDPNGNESIDNGFFLAPAVQGGAGLTVGLPYGVEIFGNYSEMLAYTYNYKGSNDIHIKTVSGGLRVNF